MSDLNKMDNLEKAELLKNKTGVSYEQANMALKACNYDVLEAMVYLEKLGEIKGEPIARFSTGNAGRSNEFELAQKSYEKSCEGKTLGNMLDSFFSWAGKVLKKSCETTFEVTRQGKRIMAVPVLLFVICLLFAFWVTLPLLIVGMFMDCRYKFIGFESTSIDINNMCDKASDVCGNIKSEMKKEEKKEEKKDVN